jgi:hypothetical protein
MKDNVRFDVEQVLKQIDSILENNTNHCDYEYFLKLKVELTSKLNKE